MKVGWLLTHQLPVALALFLSGQACSTWWIHSCKMNDSFQKQRGHMQMGFALLLWLTLFSEPPGPPGPFWLMHVSGHSLFLGSPGPTISPVKGTQAPNCGSKKSLWFILFWGSHYWVKFSLFWRLKSESEKWSRSVVSHSLRPHGL